MIVGMLNGLRLSVFFGFENKEEEDKHSVTNPVASRNREFENRASLDIVFTIENHPSSGLVLSPML